MQAQTAQLAQAAAMTAKDWYPIVVGAASAILAAIGAVILTVAWQARKERRDLKRKLFLTLMTHRKANPPHFEWVNAVNMIDVVFADHDDVLRAWKDLWDILNDKSRVGTQAHMHAQLNMLSTMALVVGFRKLKQTDIDKFYSPEVYATQAAASQELSTLARGFLENVNNFIASQQRNQTINQPPVERRTTMPPPGHNPIP